MTTIEEQLEFVKNVYNDLKDGSFCLFPIQKDVINDIASTVAAVKKLEEDNKRLTNDLMNALSIIEKLKQS